MPTVLRGVKFDRVVLPYNQNMARGWESKSVEDQINEKENASTVSNTSRLTPEQFALHEKREGLLLARTRTLRGLENTRDARYRALLETTLAHVDSLLAELDRTNSSTTK